MVKIKKSILFVRQVGFFICIIIIHRPRTNTMVVFEVNIDLCRV
jgi:hypothetical protein